MKIQNMILLFLSLFSLTIAHGERMPELRKDASHVLVGKVTGVFKSDEKEHIRYVVRILVTTLEKGNKAAKGQYFYVECFERKPQKGSFEQAPGESGHSGIPKISDRVRVFINEKYSIYVGVYPNWYDVLPKEGKK